jgi:flagellar motor switch protein FliN/FliY
MSDESVASGQHAVPEKPDLENQGAPRETRRPEYAPVTDTSVPGRNRSLNRFLDVSVTLSAELGRVTIPIGELVELGEGSVVELKRSVNSPVNLMAQGQRVATGEVVVIDDCFAVRIKSVDSMDSDDG